MDTTQMEALIGMLFVLGLLALMVLPAVVGIARDRRTDRQLRQAETDSAAAERGTAGRAAAAWRRTAAGPSRPAGSTAHGPARCAATRHTAHAA
ncbi:hypothetical protein JL475_13900 [Streptomyces sp. M2CJ-2]|uniref:hypothetical protein n=1 Tax=Streptomyces sp. M2CJ-2 TaxID=2803948 RepID=UPI0019261EFC|nr:hypothetical protein [Streptomyces sp. M2CJ-2]MBL3667064.1 hypothetical protein [Streptomyces sp. M2CJ-2]